MQRKIFSALFKYNKYYNYICSSGLGDIIQYIEHSPAEEIQKNILFFSERTKAMMDVSELSHKDFDRLKGIILNDHSIKQKAALGLLFNHIDKSAVKKFVRKELTDQYIDWSLFKNKVITDSLNRKYKVTPFALGPLAHIMYIMPLFKDFSCSSKHPCADFDTANHGLPDFSFALAGRFLFSAEKDNYGFLPIEDKNHHLSKNELGFLLENTSLPESELAKAFIGKGVYGAFARLCFAILPGASHLYLTDIQERETVTRLNNGENFAQTVFGKTFLGAGFLYKNSEKFYDPTHEIKPWYGIDVQRP